MLMKMRNVGRKTPILAHASGTYAMESEPIFVAISERKLLVSRRIGRKISPAKRPKLLYGSSQARVTPPAPAAVARSATVKIVQRVFVHAGLNWRNFFLVRNRFAMRAMMSWKIPSGQMIEQ